MTKFEAKTIDEVLNVLDKQYNFKNFHDEVLTTTNLFTNTNLTIDNRKGEYVYYQTNTYTNRNIPEPFATINGHSETEHALESTYPGEFLKAEKVTDIPLHKSKSSKRVLHLNNASLRQLKRLKHGFKCTITINGETKKLDVYKYKEDVFGNNIISFFLVGTKKKLHFGIYGSKIDIKNIGIIIDYIKKEAVEIS